MALQDLIHDQNCSRVHSHRSTYYAQLWSWLPKKCKAWSLNKVDNYPIICLRELFIVIVTKVLRRQKLLLNSLVYAYYIWNLIQLAVTGNEMSFKIVDDRRMGLSIPSNILDSLDTQVNMFVRQSPLLFWNMDRSCF